MMTIVHLICLFPFTLLFKSPKDFQVSDVINGFIAGVFHSAVQNAMDSCDENPNIQYGGYKCSAVWATVGCIGICLLGITSGILFICSMCNYVKYGWPKFQRGWFKKAIRQGIGFVIGRTLVRN